MQQRLELNKMDIAEILRSHELDYLELDDKTHSMKVMIQRHILHSDNLQRDLPFARVAN